MTCDREGCDKQARWAAYAAYDHAPGMHHPHVARYPNPMAHACDGEHLAWLLGRDAANIGSTKQWVVKPV